MTRTACALLLVATFATSASAHPIPKTRYDRTVAVRLTPTGVKVVYKLDVSLLTLHLEQNSRFTKEEIAALDRTEKGYAAAFARKLGPVVADTLKATADGKPLAFRVEKADVTLTDHAE